MTTPGSSGEAPVARSSSSDRLRRARRLLTIAQNLMDSEEPVESVRSAQPAAAGTSGVATVGGNGGSHDRQSQVPTSQAHARTPTPNTGPNQELRTLFSFPRSGRREQSRPSFSRGAFSYYGRGWAGKFWQNMWIPLIQIKKTLVTPPPKKMWRWLC